MTSGPLFFTMLFQIIEVCGYSLQSGGGLGFEALIWKFVLGFIVLLCDPVPVMF